MEQFPDAPTAGSNFFKDPIPLEGMPVPESPPLCEFEVALNLIKNGRCVARKGWNGKGQYVALIVPLEGTKMTLPYIFIHTAQGERVPWIASQGDLLAEDWHIVS